MSRQKEFWMFREETEVTLMAIVFTRRGRNCAIIIVLILCVANDRNGIYNSAYIFQVNEKYAL
jgi:hypothetical protein